MNFDSSTIENIIDRLRAERKTISSSISNLEALETKIDACWNTNIEKEYKARYDKALKNLKTYNAELKKCTQYLKYINNKFNSVEQSNQNIIGR